MYLTSIDTIAIRDLLKQVETILGEYNESPFDQIDTLRARISEAQDVVEDTTGYDVGDEDEESPLDEANAQLERDFHLHR